MLRLHCITARWIVPLVIAIIGICSAPAHAEETLTFVPRLGVWADNMLLDGGRAGIRVVRIELNGPVMYLRELPQEFNSPRKFLLPYRDVIVAVNGQRVTRVDELNAALRVAAEESRLTILNRTTGREDRFYITLP